MLDRTMCSLDDASPTDVTSALDCIQAGDNHNCYTHYAHANPTHMHQVCHASSLYSPKPSLSLHNDSVPTHIEGYIVYVDALSKGRIVQRTHHPRDH